MPTPGTRDSLVAVLAGAAGTGIALAFDAPVAALAGVAAGAGFVAMRALSGRRASETPEAAHSAQPQPAAESEGLMAVLARDVARAERYGEPLTVCMVRADGLDTASPEAGETLTSHLRATVDRITRASDSWFEIGDGVFAVVLERCNFQEAAAFGERLALAAGSRPVLVDGQRHAASIVLSATQYDVHQFLGAKDFIAAARAARMAAPGHRRRLVNDGRFLRRSIYGQAERTEGAA